MKTGYSPSIEIGTGLLKSEISRIKNKSVLLMTSKTPYSLLKEDLGEFDPIIVESNDITKLKEIASSKFIKGADVILGVGSGTVIDGAKTVSYLSNKELIAVPSVLSTNVFATNKSVIFEKDRIKSIESKIPERVVIDFDVIKLAKRGYNLSGVGDILSIFTAIYDWKLAVEKQEEKTNPLVMNLAEALLNTLKEEYTNIIKLDEAGLRKLAECLIYSGYLTILYGSGRPESGSEHMFSCAIDQERKHKLLHGESVILGILLSSELQGQDNELIYKIANEIGLLNSLKKSSFTEKDAVHYLLKASLIRRGRFTIFNVINLNRKSATEIVSKVFLKLKNGK